MAERGRPGVSSRGAHVRSFVAPWHQGSRERYVTRAGRERYVTRAGRERYVTRAGRERYVTRAGRERCRPRRRRALKCLSTRCKPCFLERIGTSIHRVLCIFSLDILADALCSTRRHGELAIAMANNLSIYYALCSTRRHGVGGGGRRGALFGEARLGAPYCWAETGGGSGATDAGLHPQRM